MNKKLIIILFSSLLLLVTFSTDQAIAENRGGFVSGRIIDKDRNIGVMNALIRVEKEGKMITVRSDSEGNYKIANLETGNYTFRVLSPDGYMPYLPEKSITMKAGEEVKDVDFSLEPYYDYVISGSVFLSYGKTPLGGAEIIAYNTASDIPEGFATSEKDGSYTIRGLKPATYNLVIESSDVAFPVKKNIVLTEKETSGINFFAFNNLISGVVKDERGAPIENAKLSIRYMPTEKDIKDIDAVRDNVLVTAKMIVSARMVKTDKSGKYEITSLMPGNYNIEISATNYGREVKKNLVVENNSKISNLDFRLRVTEKISNIYGEVLGEDGITPIANALILLADSNNTIVGEILKSSDKGTFKIEEGLGEGTYYLVAQKEGLATSTKEIKIQGGEKIDVKLVMGIPGSISGTVYQKDKKTPAKKIGVIASKNENDSVGITVTDANGFYKINDLKEGTYKLEAISLDGKKGYIENVKVKANKETSNIAIFLNELEE